MKRFIAIEGVDGTGKTTQFNLLVEYLREQLNHPVLELDFPRYGEMSARYVERYLNGTYGGDIAPDLVVMFYALDRWQAKPAMMNFIHSNSGGKGFIVANRYVASNLAHQGGKIANVAQRREFYDEQMDLEFGQFNIPRPDLNFVLLLPEAVAQINIDKKAVRTYTARKRDLHEQDIDHLKSAAAAYRELCQLYPTQFIAIDCWDERARQMKTIDEIHGMIKLELSRYIGASTAFNLADVHSYPMIFRSPDDAIIPHN